MSNRKQLQIAMDSLAAILADVKEKNQMIDAEETHGAEFGKRPDDFAECQEILENMTTELARLRAENKALREMLEREAASWDSDAVSAETCIERRLYENAQEKLEFKSEARHARNRAAAIRAHLAQSDSPGAGVKGEKT